MKKGRRVFIATSGWHYGHWRGPFYPEYVPKKHFLDYYSTRFDTVEINNSFYRLPNESTLRAWKETVPPDFIFSVKASRLITHNKKLKDPGITLPNFFERVSILGEKLGPILFQLPPGWGVNAERLKSFLEALPRGHKYAFEFRNPSWFNPAVYKLLSLHNAAFCIYDINWTQSPREVTADFAYVRLHGPDGSYRGQYSDDAISGWAGQFSRWMTELEEIYCYFDNDEAGYAAIDALRLKEAVKGLRLEVA